MADVIALACAITVLLAAWIVLEWLASAQGKGALRIAVTAFLVIAVFVAFAVEPPAEPHTEPQTLQVEP